MTIQTPQSTLGVQDVDDFRTLVSCTMEQYCGLKYEEKQSFSIRNAVNDLIYKFLIARGYSVEMRKDRRGKFELVTSDERTQRAACLLLLNAEWSSQ